MGSRLARTGLAALVALLAFLLPEWLFAQLQPLYTPVFNGRFFVLATAIALLLALSLRAWSGVALGAFLLLTQLSEWLHFLFFRAFYGGADVRLLFVESEDIGLALAGTLPVFLPALGLLAAGTLLLLLARRLAPAPRWRHAGAAVLVVALVGQSLAATRMPAWKLDPDNRRTALVNGIHALSWFAGVGAPAMLYGEAAAAGRQYAPYALQPAPLPAQPSIFIVLGESLSPAHMSALGYARDTTPQLAALLAAHGGRASSVLASAVTTRVAVPMLFNLIREPDHAAEYRAQHANLFAAARAAGYHTAFLSTQKMDGLSSLIGRPHIDQWIDAVDAPPPPGPADAALGARLQQAALDFTQPQFVLINTRATHIPYAGNYTAADARFSLEPAVDRSAATVNEYDDAMRAFDAASAGVIATLLERSTRPTVIVLTSDHGQFVGEDGRFGHNVLDLRVARVPLLLWSRGDAAVDALVAGSCPQSHYELGKLLLRLLGQSLVNPNEELGVGYVNGNSARGDNGFLRYEASPSSCR